MPKLVAQRYQLGLFENRRDESQLFQISCEITENGSLAKEFHNYLGPFFSLGVLGMALLWMRNNIFNPKEDMQNCPRPQKTPHPLNH